jgi:hypothetical protein
MVAVEWFVVTARGVFVLSRLDRSLRFTRSCVVPLSRRDERVRRANRRRLGLS